MRWDMFLMFRLMDTFQMKIKIPPSMFLDDPFRSGIREFGAEFENDQAVLLN